MANFTITGSAGENGTISPVGSLLVTQGDSLLFTISPSFGYIPAVVVDGFTLAPLVYAYTFSNVQADHYINVVFNTIPFSAAQFRLDFKEFTDTTKFPDSTINFWAGLGGALLNVSRWGSLLLYGLELFVAHNVSLQAMSQASVNAGGVPGVGSGVITNQSAGGVTVGLDVQASIEDQGGNYNLTVYGTQFIRLARIVGIGGAQITGGGLYDEYYHQYFR